MFRTLVIELLEQPAQLFPRILVTALIATAGVLVLHLCLLLIARVRGGRPPALRRWNLWEKLVYTVTILSVGTLSVTSFYAVLAHGVLEGWLLLAHMVGAGTFVGVLPLLACTWAGACRFNERAATGSQQTTTRRRFLWLAKTSFWLILLSGVVTALTMLISMLPLFGTNGLRELLDAHRYCGLLVAVATIVHFYSICIARFGLG